MSSGWSQARIDILDAHERRNLLERRSIVFQSIDRGGFVAMANRHAAEQHHFRTQGQEFSDCLVPYGPSFLRAAMQSVLANEQHDILHEHTDVGPLVLSHVPVDRKEKSQGRTEKIVILGKLRQ